MTAKDLGYNIRRCRVTRGLTQKELAEKLFLAPQTVSKWERGSSVPDALLIDEISKVLGIDPASLFEAANESEWPLIAIDGGGTKTEFALFTPHGEVIARVVKGGSNPNSIGVEAATRVLKSGIDELLKNAGQIGGIFAGVAGCGVPDMGKVIGAFLKKQYPAYKSRVESDIHNIINLTEHNGKCIAAITGTGSAVFGWDGECLHRVGGWGYLFDNAGSGYDIGRDAIAYTLECESGVLPYTALSRLIEEKAGGALSGRLSELYSAGTGAIASYSREVFKAAAMGDTVAEGIIEKTAYRLASLVNHIHKTYDTGDVAIISGGLAINEERLCDMICERLDRDIKVIFSSLPPIFGAMRKCAELYSEAGDYESFREAFEKTYDRFIT